LTQFFNSGIRIVIKNPSPIIEGRDSNIFREFSFLNYAQRFCV